jgi:ubiquinone/menaquinone biosynthesis C-methylase UbiE
MPPFILDIGGEGRHPHAWNLNPRTCRTVAPHCGEPIPRLIRGRAENIPLPGHCVDRVIVERVPLRRAALEEIRRVAKSGSFVILRHAAMPWLDPHRLALRVLPGTARRSTLQLGDRTYLQTIIKLSSPVVQRHGRPAGKGETQ